MVSAPGGDLVAQFNHDSDKSSKLKEMKQILENNLS